MRRDTLEFRTHRKRLRAASNCASKIMALFFVLIARQWRDVARMAVICGNRCNMEGVSNSLRILGVGMHGMTQV
jgi:hypothetical protein